MTNIKIYQGNQIGGCVTVISTEMNGSIHRIMIDYGSSLKGSETEVDFLYPWDEEPIDAVLFTHYHGDHVGRLMEIPSNIPIYMGATARQVMINIQEALSKYDDSDEQLHLKQLKILKDNKRIHTFQRVDKKYETIVAIEGFRIEPYSIDHSAYDAYMFLIEANDETKPTGKKVILHTGDFRGHGRLGKAMLPVIEWYVHKNNRKVDTLIIEGTMMSRPNEEEKTEKKMMWKAADYLEKHKYAFLVCSSTNLDSLASFYQAAQIAARPFERYMYTYNEYLKTQLKTFSDTAGVFSNVYQFRHVHRLFLNKELKSKKWSQSMTQKELMEKTGFLAVIKPEEWCEKFIDPFIKDYKSGKIKEMPVIIYSMWNGYIQDKTTLPDGTTKDNKAKNQDWIDFFDKQKKKGVKIKYFHTSGHASKKMIKKVIKAVDPQEEIIPMHTEYPDMFEKLDISQELINKIKIPREYRK